MNEYQKNLWNDLMTLVDESEAFFYVDQEYAGTWYRIFNYRLASYTEFMRPNGLECRGHTFQISEEGKDATMLRLVSLPMEKFFNLYEVSSDINTLALTLVAQGRLSEDVFKKIKPFSPS